MKSLLIILLLVFNSLFIFSQKKKIFLFDKNKEPINRFEVFFYKNAKDKSYKNNNSNNYFYLKKKYDSIIINYNLFYTKTIKNHKFKKIDSLHLSEEVSLNEVTLNNKLTLIGTNGKVHSYGTSVNSEGINRFDVSNYINSSIKYISFYILYEYINPFVSKKKLKSSNKRFELYLFQSNNENPNIEKDTINLLKKPIIVNIGKINKDDWVKINLNSQDINIKNYKFLYVGYKNLNNYIGIGHSKTKKNKKIKSFYRTTSAVSWQHLDWYPKGGVYLPAIKIGLRK